MSVNILTGSNYYWDIIENEVLRGQSGPVAIKSKVGYILSGSFGNSVIPNSTAFVCHTLKFLSEMITDAFDKTVENFLGIEKIGIEENQSVHQDFCEQINFDENENRYKF